MAEVRVGIAHFNDRLYAWQAKVLNEIREIPGVEIVAALSCPHNNETGFVFPAASQGFRYDTTPIEAPVHCSLNAAAKNIPLDVVLNLTRADVTTATDSRIWRLHFGRNDALGRAEVADRLPISQVMLCDERSGDVWGEACFKTAANDRRNCDKLTMGAAFLFARALRAIAEGLPNPHSPRPPSPPAQRWLPRATGRLANRITKRITRSDWTLGYVPASFADIIRQRALPDVIWLRGLPKGRFFADPFPVEKSGSIISILAENGLAAPPYNGHISEISFDTTGSVLRVRDAVVTPEHLSFPFMLKLAGRNYCMLKCADALHLFAQENDAWRSHSAFMHGKPIIDPVLLRHDQKWWLFCCDRTKDDITNLDLFFADELLGPWTPHPLNPVKSDVRSSRPAGAIVEVDGALYRPTQDCSRRYGGAISVERIVRLSEQAFEEETVFRIEPTMLGRDFLGIHTLNSCGDVTLIDGLRSRLALGIAA